MAETAKIRAGEVPPKSAITAQGIGEELYVEPLPDAPRNGLAPPLTRRRLQIFIAMMLVDIGIILGSFASLGFAYLILYREQLTIDTAMLSAYLLLPIFLTIGLFNGTYSGTALSDAKQASWRLIQALVISALLLNFFAFFAKMNAEFSRVAFAASVVGSLVLMSLMRVALVRMGKRIWGKGPINRLLIFAGGPEVSLPDAYQLNAKEHGLAPRLEDPEALDRLAKYLRNMDEIMVSCCEEDRANWSQVLKGTGCHAEIVTLIDQDVGALGIRHYAKQDFSTLIVAAGTLRVRDRMQKRAFDLVVSFFALIALWPLFLMVALAILLEDGGPVFFRQKRVGRGNHFFSIYKFRSMKVEREDANGARSASREDDRITRVGKIIRRTSIDELPQLLNVLLGDMSMVGPRPHALGSQAGEKLFWEVDLQYWQRHRLRPGITGLAQVRGYRGATQSEDDLSNRLQSDLEYLRDWSLWQDITIIASTVRVLIHDRAF